MSRRYVLITPCRNEMQYLADTIRTVAGQSERPHRWIIVDDGSTDRTPLILAEAAEKYDFIEVITRTDRGDRSVGPGVIDAFYEGYERVRDDAFDYICKLDADLELPSGYFAELMNRMEANPRIGTCSGKAYYRDENDDLVSEACSDEVSVGASKFFRRVCFEDIGGFVREVMWDGIDCHRCRQRGWIAVSWDLTALRFIHLRPMGSSHKGVIRGRMRHGYGQWFMGTGPAYMAASAAYRMTRPPRIIGGLAMFAGYLLSAITRRPRYDDLEFRQFMRAYQRDCLRLGKTEATRRLNEIQADVWRERFEAPAPAAAAA